MKKYNLTAKVTINLSTVVYANSLEEALQTAEDRDIEQAHYDDIEQAEELWVYEEDLDEKPYDIKEE